MYYCSMYSKELLKGTIEVIILQLLSQHGKMYGYELSQLVRKKTDGKIDLKDGSLYPALHKLSKEGKLEFEEEHIGKRVRKYYMLTEKGKKQRIHLQDEVRSFMDTLRKIAFDDINMSPA